LKQLAHRSFVPAFNKGGSIAFCEGTIKHVTREQNYIDVFSRKEQANGHGHRAYNVLIAFLYKIYIFV
jgi:hypothetical protein